MKTEDEWAVRVKGLLKAELKRRDVTYEQLAQKLREVGVNETPAAIANKISRGRFTAVFMMQALSVIGCKNLRLTVE
jgi:3-mercaptopyruvate sulfurtransferase SseA